MTIDRILVSRFPIFVIKSLESLEYELLNGSQDFLGSVIS